MKTKTVHLKFDSKQHADDVIRLSPDVILVVEIGTLYTKEQLDDNGDVVSKAEAKSGWHVDLMLKDNCKFFDDYVVTAVTPAHEFAE